MLAVGLALLAAACWGTADFVAGLTSRRLPALVVLLAQLAAGVPIAALVIVAVGEHLPSGRTVLLAALAGAAAAFALGAFYRALAVGTMSVVAPISASGVTLPVAVGIATGDRPSALQAVGLALTVVGVVLASREGGDGTARAASRTAVGLSLVAAIGIGAFFTISDAAADDSVLWLLVISRSTAVVVIAAVLVASRTRPAVPGARDLRTLVAVGALDLAATGLYGVANTKGLLSIVAVVGSLYPVTTVLLARFVLSERLRGVQAAGVALAFGGVAAVAGGG